MRCLHVITGLTTGGAEMMLHKLLAASQGRTVTHAVVALNHGGPVADLIAGLGVPVTALGGARGRVPGASLLWRLRRVARHFAPDVLQGWMYHGNLAAHAAAWARPVAWNIRSTLCDVNEEKRFTAAVIRLGARLSEWPARIIYPSEAAALEHEAAGYSARRRVLIENGFDTGRFAPDPAAGGRLRASLGVDAATPVLGHVARFHPMKDHETLLRAAAALRERGTRFHLVLVGSGVDEHNAALVRLRTALALDGCVSLLGERRDLAALTPGFDVAVSSSGWGEAFPNVLGEAMACGVPCVATDVGDSRRIVGEAGAIVPRRDPAALAAALSGVLELDAGARARLGAAARARVLAHYSIGAIVERYEDVWMQLRERRGEAA